MHLRKVSVTGFKSFANQTALPFEKHLTCVVGPNGSGKSNIADAIRWVLGEQSAKLLRGKKAEDVIFAGSTTKSRGSMAEVSLLFENDEPTEDVPQSELEITRRLYRDGDSEYLINNENVRLADVTQLLNRIRCGQKSYAVIGQGMVDSVVMATPREREEFFQEATGVRALQVKRDQAENKLAQTKEELARIDLVLGELQPRLRMLRRQRDRLQERDGIATELQSARLEYFAAARAALSGEFAREDAKRSAVAARLVELRDKLREAASGEQGLWQGDPTNEWQRLANEARRLQSSLAELESARQQKSLAKQRALQDAGDDGAALALQEIEALRAEASLAEGRLAEAREKRGAAAGAEGELAAALEAVEKELQSVTGAASAGAAHGTNYVTAEAKETLRALKAAIAAKDWDAAEAAAARLEAAIAVHEDEESGRERHAMAARQKELFAVARERRDALFAAQRESGAHEQEIRSLERQVADLRAKAEVREASLKAKGKGASADLFDAEISSLEHSIKAMRVEIAATQGALETAETKRQSWQREYRAAQEGVVALRQEADGLDRELAPLEQACVRAQTRLEELDRQAGEHFAPGHPLYANAVAADQNADIGELQTRYRRLEQRLAQIGDIDAAVVDECAAAETEHGFLETQSHDVREAEQRLRGLMADLDVQIDSLFHDGFAAINRSFGEFFKVLFNGGTAKLNLEEQEAQDENQEGEASSEGEGQSKKKRPVLGIDIVAVPPGKKNQGLQALSGGEKALTAIALIAAIVHNHPAPFILLDEVDAALDEANAERFAQIIKKLQEKSQIIAITHNRATMQQADTLYGVTMSEDGISRILSLSLKEIEEKLGK